MDTISGFSGKSFEKNIQKKDSGNRENGVQLSGINLVPQLFRATRADDPVFPESLRENCTGKILFSGNRPGEFPF